MKINKIEIVGAVVVLVLLTFLTLPKCFRVLEQSKGIATKKGLSSLRSAIAVYYADNNGKYPGTNIAKDLVEKGYIEKIPYAYIPRHNHKKSNYITTTNLDKNTDSGGWAYKVDDTPDSSGRTKGRIWINCSQGDWSKL
jgi:hypothetical protein